MAKLKLLPPKRTPALGPVPPIDNEVMAEVHRRERTSRKDVIWVGVALAAFLAASMIYENGHRSDRQTAERQAQLRAATATALPPPGYDAASRYPSAGEFEADAAVREARALLAANAAENKADPVLNPKAAAEPTVTVPPPPPPKPFSDPNFGTSTFSPGAATPTPTPAQAQVAPAKPAPTPPR